MFALIRGQKPVNRSLGWFTQPNMPDSHPAETPPACLKKTLHQIQSHGRLWKCTSCPPPPALVAVGERTLFKKCCLKQKGHNETSVIPSFLATLASFRESTIPKPMSLFSRTCAVSWKVHNDNFSSVLFILHALQSRLPLSTKQKPSFWPCKKQSTICPGGNKARIVLLRS